MTRSALSAAQDVEEALSDPLFKWKEHHEACSRCVSPGYAGGRCPEGTALFFGAVDEIADVAGIDRFSAMMGRGREQVPGPVFLADLRDD